VGAVQASVHRFDADSGAGSVLTDQGLVLAFSAEAFAGSGLRHLRVGQRLSIELSGSGPGDEVASMRLGTVGVSPAVHRQ
jgi:cold shock CspA family protein